VTKLVGKYKYGSDEVGKQPQVRSKRWFSCTVREVSEDGLITIQVPFKLDLNPI